MVNGQLVAGAGYYEVEAGGDIGFAATTLAGNQEPLDRCEEDAGQRGTAFTSTPTGSGRALLCSIESL